MRDDDLRTGEVRRLAVSPSHRRRGVGEKLLEVVAAHGRAQGLDALCLGTSGFNKAAVKMYTKNEWTVENTMRVRFVGIPGCREVPKEFGLVYYLWLRKFRRSG